MKRLVASILILLVSPLAFSQSKVSQEIVVTASSVPETIESTPASVTVVTKKEIEERAARDVIDVLREVPGLTISRTGSQGKIASVFIRGASSKQTLVLWNGVEINDPYFSGYNWGQFSTVGVQRIEIARGPFSSLYGADAVGGVVNIITVGGADHAEADISAGGRGLFNGVVALAQTSGPASYHFAVEHRQDNGFAPNDNDRQNSLLGGVTLAISRNASIGLTGRSATYDLGVPRNTNAFATAYMATPHHREHGKEWQLAVPVTVDLSGVHAQLRYSQSHRDDHNEDPDAQSFADTRSKRRGVHLVLSGTTVIGRVAGGFETDKSEADNRDSFGLDIDTHQRKSTAFFVEDRFSHGPFELSLGLRRDHYETFGSETSPRVAVAWTADGNKFRAAYGQAFRAPQIGELYLPFFGNPDLHAERSSSAEIGYDRFFTTDASLSLTLFQSNHRQLITYDLAANHFANIGRARSRGVEVAGNDRRGAFTTAISYTYLRATEEPSGAQLVRRPKHSGSLAFGYEPGAWGAQFVIARVGSRPDVNDLFPFANVVNRAYTVADLTLRRNMGAFAPYVKIENLTNSRYQEVFGYPSPTRRALIGIRYSASR